MSREEFRDVLMECLPWTDYDARIKKGGVVFIPVGAIEQHGPHLPLGTDMYLAQGMSMRVAREVGGMVAHPLSYGYRSLPRCGGGNHFPGTTSLSGYTLSSMLLEVLQEFRRHGARNIVVLNGHLENSWFLIEGIERFMQAGGQRDTRVMRLEYWDFITPETTNKVFDNQFTSWALEHAAIMETSCMMDMHPDQVRVDLIPEEPDASFPPYDHFPTHTHWVPSSGVLSSAKRATPEKGALMNREFTALISEAIKHEFGDATKLGL